ncbi:MAG: hypothetical protein M1836_007086 [Candelina mexicana]|nr:MAG: hypothetical protein M1836_007086 [Candelina mexicana]
MQNCSPLLNLRYLSRRAAASITAVVVAIPTTIFVPPRPTLSNRCLDHKPTQLRLYTSNFTVPVDDDQDLTTSDRLSCPPSKTSLGASTAGNDSLLQPSRSSRGDPNAWVAYLEPYLPSQLRWPSSAYPLDIDETPQKPLGDLPHLLFQARRQRNVDVLSYIGVHQDRWQAVLWVVRNLLSGSSGDDNSMRAVITYPAIPWSTEGPLEEATNSAIWAECPNLDGSASAGNLKTQTRWEYFAIERSSARASLSQIWQSLGSMVLQAAERAGEEARCIMAHVLQIIACLHHSGVVPDTVYRYKPAEDQLSLKRPPTLHILSSRILTALSDAVWRAHESQVATEAAAVGAQYHYLGFEVPGARYKLKVRELGPEVWMELILWSCVDGGLVKEGAWILQQLRRRVGQKKWSVIDWKAVEQPKVGHNPKTARIDWEGIRHRTGGVALGWIDGYSGDRPFVELGERTISSEVVAALIDGLVDSIRVGVSNRSNAASTILDYISVLKNILERDRFGLGPNSWNQIIVRILESGGVNPEIDPAILERVLELAPTYLKELEASNAPILENDDGLVLRNYVLEQSAAAVGLSHRVLSAYIKSGNIRGSLRAFARLQALTDANKKKSITEFTDRLKRKVRGIANDSDPMVDDLGSPISEVPGFFPQIPRPLLASFLGLVTEAKAYKFGRWLLYANEVDGRVIPTRLYTTPEMAPELLRFAAATSDDQLLDRVTRALGPPLPERTLRALLHCQISFRNWDAVEVVLIHARDEVSTGWEASDAAELARAILILEAADHRASVESEGSPKLEACTRAKGILKRLLHGEFTPITSPSLKRSLSRSKEQQSLCQIFKTISSTLADLCPSDLSEHKRAVDLPIQAFNILLSGVVETRSSVEGKRLWDLYCQSPTTSHQAGTDAGVPRRSSNQADQRKENTTLAAFQRPPPVENAVPPVDDRQLVVPNLSTLRLITQAAIRERQELLNAAQTTATVETTSSPTESQATSSAKEQIETLDNLLQWAGNMFRKFHVADEDIDEELGGFHHKKRRREKVMRNEQVSGDIDHV